MPAPGMMAASMRPWKEPLLPKTLILPSASPATRYLAPCCVSMASAVSAAGSASAPAGTCTSRWRLTVTFAGGTPRYCESFSPPASGGCPRWPRRRRGSRARTLCSRMTPPASPVAMRNWSCAGDTAICTTGAPCPAEKAARGSPAGERSRTSPSCRATASSTEGNSGSPATGCWARGLCSGRRPTKLAASSRRTTALETR
mmetsp:Transcript_16066/g.50374  ORF Transcript_16066/g.50374 Transcript_16066/m.50374 type:complete len:201 (-) Transcript_16066:254-856(-)